MSAVPRPPGNSSAQSGWCVSSIAWFRIGRAGKLERAAPGRYSGRVELEQQPRREPVFLHANAEQVRATADGRTWTTLLEDADSKLEYERYLREHAIVVDDVE
jgi:hypothetical protein